MVKGLVLVLLCAFLLHAESKDYQKAVLKKVQTLLTPKSFEENKAFLKIIFSPPQKFMKNDRVDSVKIIEMLKENGLLKLFFDKPTRMELEFRTSGTPLFFVKIVADTLRNIGYYRYVTKSSTYSSSEFSWSVSIVSEYSADPMILQKELQKSGCDIVDIERKNPTKWLYVIDMQHARLPVTSLQSGHILTLRRSLEPHWLNVSQIRKIRFVSKGRNHWYPYLSFYDAHLHLVKVLQRDKRSYDITVVVPKTAVYLKIADIYTMKNIKDPLVLYPKGAR